MNRYHRRCCSSAGWTETVEETILPLVLDGLDLGDDVLELGPGYGATTRPLAARLPRLTAAELDPELAAGLRADLAGRVEVVEADARALPFPDGRFSAVLCFTMLHHVESPAAQDEVFREVRRVLRPGGVFAGADSRTSLRFRLIHLFDTIVPIDPATLPGRLEAAGFAAVDVTANERRLRFAARA